MSSDHSPHHPSFNDDDVIDDDDDDNTSLNGPTSDTSSSDTTNMILPLTTATPIAVTIAVPATTVPPTATTTTATAVALPKKKPSAGLFQRLWTDEDEIELLQGFLDYTTSRGTAGSSHHHDTAAFYDQIKSKLQLDFNKNQLVEKLRRLKKKYRTALAKMSSGKDFSFKSPHDQTTFEISSKIWSSLKTGGKHPCVEYDDDDCNLIPTSNYAPEINSGGSGSGSGGFYISQINLNTPIGDQNKGSYASVGGSLQGKLSTRKRPRVVDKTDEGKFVKVGLVESGRNEVVDYNVNANNVTVDAGGGGGGGGGNSHNGNTNVYGGVAIQGLIEETVRSTLSPMFKELVGNAVNGSSLGGGKKVFGVEELGLNSIPLNFPRVNSGEVIDEKWRNQQILELEVYSKRLELVQDYIKFTLDELRSMRGVNNRGL